MATSNTVPKIMQLSTAEFKTLSTTGTLTKDGETYTYSPNDTIYVTPNNETLHEYSTTEHIVGSFDGDLVYEKTFVATTPNNTTTLEFADITDLNLGRLLSLNASVMTTNNISWIGQNSVYVWIRRSEKKLACQVVNTAYCNGTLIVTIQYTKAS